MNEADVLPDFLSGSLCGLETIRYWFKSGISDVGRSENGYEGDITCQCGSLTELLRKTAFILDNTEKRDYYH